MVKWVQFFVIVAACIAADQWTKHIASDNLASSHPSAFDHPVILRVDAHHDGSTVSEVLTDRFTHNNAEEIRRIAQRYVVDDGGLALQPDAKVSAGQAIHVTYRKVVVIPGYWDFEYTRNPGAAFGILSTSDSPYRIPFFIGVVLLAVIVILFIMRGVTIKQQILIWALALICGGAIGNFIDRASFGYVIDFIVWKYGDEYRWPTFNVADAFISVGVSLMILEMILDAIRHGRTDEEPAGAEKTANVAADEEE